MTVSGNAVIAPFPETVQMTTGSTDRVRRHRAARSAIRVEVEVPTPDDALAVKRFARDRRHGHRPAPAAPPMEIGSIDREQLAASVVNLSTQHLVALRLFIAGLEGAQSAELVERANRVAATFHDAVQRVAGGRRVG